MIVHQWCARCQIRRAVRDDLCYRCGNLEAPPPPLVGRSATPPPEPPIEMPPLLPRRVIRVGDREFEVVWDGT